MLHDYGIARIYSPDDGREMGLQGMINDLLKQSDYPIGQSLNGQLKRVPKKDTTSIARLISAAENYPEQNIQWLADLKETIKDSKIPVLGITGTGGAGKSSLVDELVMRYLINFQKKPWALFQLTHPKGKRAVLY